LRKIRDIFGKIVIGVCSVSMLACFIIVIMTTVDVLLRKVSVYSVLGSTEMTEMLMVVTMSFGIPALHVVNGHVRVDIFVNKIPGRGKFFFESFILLAESVLLGIMVWGSYEKTKTLVARGTSTAVLHVPQLPFAFCLCIGLTLFCVLLLMDTVIAFLNGIFYEKSLNER
jgi:TRAP-type C4-dicarboxylate transport system permease small subunit